MFIISVMIIFLFANSSSTCSYFPLDCPKPINLIVFLFFRVSGHKADLQYKSRNTDQPMRRKNRKREVIWFNPPYSKDVTTNLGIELLNIFENNHFDRDKNLNPTPNLMWKFLKTDKPYHPGQQLVTFRGPEKTVYLENIF